MKLVVKSFLTLITFILLFNQNTHAQNEANIWHFGNQCGLDFNTGEPIIIPDVAYQGGYATASISDSLGNFLFSCNGYRIWNRSGEIMQNGNDLIGHWAASQGALILQKPGSQNLYYVFTVGQYQHPIGLHYSIVDMNLDGGLGAVTAEKNILLDGTEFAVEKLTSVRHANGNDIWIIIRTLVDDAFMSFLLTSSGVNNQAVISPTIDRTQNGGRGSMKVSLDKKYLVAAAEGNDYLHEFNNTLEICRFDASSGDVAFLYTISRSIPNFRYSPYSVEFSPDSKILYAAYHPEFSTDGMELYQYNMQYIEDSLQFKQSETFIAKGPVHGLQLARDGKIYCTTSDDIRYDHISIIHDPWKPGVDCNYEADAIYFGMDRVGQYLPNILLDHLYRFEWEGNCSGIPVAFQPNFIPDPANIFWNFGDGGISTDLWPEHTYQQGGEYEVFVRVVYPSGRIEETSRIITVHESPHPELGPDTLFCEGGSIILNESNETGMYQWSNGSFGLNVNSITVSDTGWYWVKVTNDEGCFGVDSIHIMSYPSALADTTNLEVIPTTCGGSTGVIKGLSVNGTPPLSYQWLDDLGNPISNSLDIYHLPVGNYTLEVIDGNDCVNSFGPYAITDAGDVLISSVEYTNEHCGQQNASIIVTALSGLGDMLFYSIDNGVTYLTNQGIFTGLFAGNYAVRVQDSSNCQSVYVNNPVIIQNMDAPEISDIQIGACTFGQSNGSIEISALGGSDTLFFSNDNGANFQINDGGFYNLLAGFYTCIVIDEIGCDTTFIVEVPEEVSIRLQALAGDEEVCPGNAAFVPLYVTNFNDVANFKTTLLYDKSLISCTGFANANILLEDSLEAMLFPAEGKIELIWHSVPLTLPGNASLADLIFESLDPGVSLVDWDGSSGASLFENSSGLIIPVDYYLGSVRIYQEVLFTIGTYIEACQGEDIFIFPNVWSSNGPVSYLWTDPSGASSSSEILSIDNTQISQSGTYTLLVKDSLDCYSEDSVQVLIYPEPEPAFAGQDTITTEEPIELDAGSGFLSYQWNTGENDQYIMAEYEDWYKVMIESQYGCFGEDSVYVMFISAPPPPEPVYDHFQIPNAFTPDGNGLNDEFKVISPSDNMGSFKMYIYNRWGQLVFENQDVLLGWDGKYKTKPAPAGTYVYKIIYSIGKFDFDASGTVLLIR